MHDIQQFVERHFQDDYLNYGHPMSDMRVCCPFCNERYGTEDSKYKLHISINKQTSHCFRCDYTASWIRLVMDLMEVSYHMAIGELYRKPIPVNFDKLADIYNGKEYKKRDGLPSDLTFPRDYKPLTEKTRLTAPARKYMLRRGFTEDHFQYYKLGVAPTREPNRVYIPVEDRYYQARAIYPFMDPKYMTPNMESEDVLFNPLALKLYDEVAIAEGTLSAISIGKNAVALLGANPTKSKVERLIEATVKHYIIAVEKGKEFQMSKLAKDLTSNGKEITMWYYPEDADPADGKPVRTARYDLREHVRTLLEQP